MSGHLSETLKVRVEADTRAELERQAELAGTKPAWLHRTILREELERRRAELEKAGRGS